MFFFLFSYFDYNSSFSFFASREECFGGKRGGGGSGESREERCLINKGGQRTSSAAALLQQPSCHHLAASAAEDEQRLILLLPSFIPPLLWLFLSYWYIMPGLMTTTYYEVGFFRHSEKSKDKRAIVCFILIWCFFLFTDSKQCTHLELLIVVFSLWPIFQIILGPLSIVCRYTRLVHFEKSWPQARIFNYMLRRLNTERTGPCGLL